MSCSFTVAEKPHIATSSDMESRVDKRVCHTDIAQ